MKTYEAMFVFDPGFGADGAKVEQEVQRIMDRATAQIIMSQKWEERKLAYEIDGRKRGVYWLTFFRAEPDKISGIERDCQLSETILRILVLRADHMTEDDMHKAYPARGQASAEDRERDHEGDERARRRHRESDDRGAEPTPEEREPATAGVATGGDMED